MTDGLVCWKCGSAVADHPLPLARLAECLVCRADLHVCRLCEYYDTRVAKRCRETVAEEVQDKERANFCGYFQARAGAGSGNHEASSPDAQSQLEALFGGGAPKVEKVHNNMTASRPAADSDRERLEKLFDAGEGEL